MFIINLRGISYKKTSPLNNQKIIAAYPSLAYVNTLQSYEAIKDREVYERIGFLKYVPYAKMWRQGIISVGKAKFNWFVNISRLSFKWIKLIEK